MTGRHPGVHTSYESFPDDRVVVPEESEVSDEERESELRRGLAKREPEPTIREMVAQRLDRLRKPETGMSWDELFAMFNKHPRVSRMQASVWADTIFRKGVTPTDELS